MSHTDPLDLYRTDSDLLPPLDPFVPRGLARPGQESAQEARDRLPDDAQPETPARRGLPVPGRGALEPVGPGGGRTCSASSTSWPSETGKSSPCRHAPAPTFPRELGKSPEHENVGAVRKAGIRIEVWGWGVPSIHARRVECVVVDCS